MQVTGRLVRTPLASRPGPFPRGRKALPAGLHGGNLAAVLDVVSYLTVLPQLSETENAVTNTLTVSLIRPVALGQQLQARATVLRRGCNLVYLRADATSDGELVGAAQVAKTVLRIRP